MRFASSARPRRRGAELADVDRLEELGQLARDHYPPGAPRTLAKSATVSVMRCGLRRRPARKAERRRFERFAPFADLRGKKTVEKKLRSREAARRKCRGRGRGTGDGHDREPGCAHGRDEPRARIGKRRRARIAGQRNRTAALELGDDARRGARLVVLV